MLELPPLSLYVHIPWCLRKCPYCDFNSYEASGELPVAAYLQRLQEEVRAEAPMAQGRKLSSVFFGGGTPSLFPAAAIAELLERVAEEIGFAEGAEITLEVNPGASEYRNLRALLEAGVNRLSFGAQSFDDEKLKVLGRIHRAEETFRAVADARAAGFSNFNIDLMHGLPGQSPEGALRDIEMALSLRPTHLSWYQLTIEANTAFYSQPPVLPNEEVLESIQVAGQALLSAQGYEQYEVSAFAQSGWASQHNLNYWRFGDYLGIGAGAHGKLSFPSENRICRYQKTRVPKDYLAARVALNLKPIAREEMTLEYMMNCLRLIRGTALSDFPLRTGLSLNTIQRSLQALRADALLEHSEHSLQLTALGQRYLNSTLEYFMDA